MYAALTWWVEGSTLHYVTTQNTHNQASLDLIDVDRTTKLNQDHNVPFSIPGRWPAQETNITFEEIVIRQLCRQRPFCSLENTVDDFAVPGVHVEEYEKN